MRETLLFVVCLGLAVLLLAAAGAGFVAGWFFGMREQKKK